MVLEVRGEARLASFDLQALPRTIVLSLGGLPPAPLIGRIPHRPTDRGLEPRHERAVEFEVVAALCFEEAPDVLK
jgi:hypothetical protein